MRAEVEVSAVIKGGRMPKNARTAVERDLRAQRGKEARRLVGALRAAGLSDLAIAYHAGVSWRSVYRWRTGGTAPHPGQLGKLRELASMKGIA